MIFKQQTDSSKIWSDRYGLLRTEPEHWRRQNDNWGGGRIFIYVRSA